MAEDGPRIIYVVDDDRDVRQSLAFQLRTLGYEVSPFGDATDFLEALDHLAPGCILLDVRMAGIDGLHAIAELRRREIGWPIIMMTGHAEVAIAVEAMKQGALDFLEKPFEEDVLEAALERALAQLAEQQLRRDASADAERRIASLSPREQDVLRAMLDGTSNKLIAYELDLSVRTVEMHRANVLAKLGVRNVTQAAMLANRRQS